MEHPGRAVQVDPIKPTLKPPGTKRLKLKCDILGLTSAFKFKSRRYIPGVEKPKDVADSLTNFGVDPAGEFAVAGNGDGELFVFDVASVGRCRLTLSNPR